MLQLAAGGAEAVQDVVLPYAVDPLPPGGQDTRHKVPALTLPRAERANNLEGERETVDSGVPITQE